MNNIPSDPILEKYAEELEAARRTKAELEDEIRSELERCNLLLEDLRRQLAKIYGPRVEGFTPEQLDTLATAFIECTPEFASAADSAGEADAHQTPPEKQ